MAILHASFQTFGRQPCWAIDVWATEVGRLGDMPWTFRETRKDQRYGNTNDGYIQQHYLFATAILMAVATSQEPDIQLHSVHAAKSYPLY